MSVNAARLLLRLLDKFSRDTNVYIAAWGEATFTLHGLPDTVVATANKRLRRVSFPNDEKPRLVFTRKVLKNIRQSGLVKRVLLPRPHNGTAFVHVTSPLPACPAPGEPLPQEQPASSAWLRLSEHIHELLSRNNKSVAWLAMVMEEYCLRRNMMLVQKPSQ